MNHQVFEDNRIDALASFLQDHSTDRGERFPRAGAVGLVELLLHFTAQYAPDGNLSSFSAQSIADAVGWEGDAELLVTAYEDAGFLKPARRFEGWELLSEWSDA